jgi:D-alanyl-D-alanine carboxypeptidase
LRGLNSAAVAVVGVMCCAVAASPASAHVGPAIAALAPGTDGRTLGHLPYGDVSMADLVVAPAGFSVGATCRINRAVAPDLDRLLTAAADEPGVSRSLRGISCHRSIAHQTAVFCHEGRRTACVNAVDRARSVAPPGYSEHATGYAIDFGIRPTRACPDVSYCFASTPAGQWLLAHAPDYGFELSFPAGNQQGVTWEPWHWRWVGTGPDVPGAAAARSLFARARSQYPARPVARDVRASNAAAVGVPAGRVAAMAVPLPDISRARVRRR